MDSFSERREAVLAKSKIAIDKARNSDRQARMRARSQVKKISNFDNLPVSTQEQMLHEAEEKIMTKRKAMNQDGDTKEASILDEETVEMEKIAAEEKASYEEVLGGDSEGKSKKRKRVDTDEEDEEESEIPLIQKAFSKHMTPVIEKWERLIVAGGTDLTKEVSQEELRAFAKDTSNPEDVLNYLRKWNAEDADLDEGLREGDIEEEEEEDDDIEVFISEDEEAEEAEEGEEGEEDNDEEGWIVGDEEVEIKAEVSGDEL